jgi:hypothetical protein
LTDYRLHAEDLPAPVGLMTYEHPPVERTGNEDGDGITLVSWGPGRGGLWVHTWAVVTESWTNGFARLGRTLAELPHEILLARARKAAQHTQVDPSPDTTADEAVDWFLAGLLPKLQRAPIPPSVSPPHGYHWRGLTPMEFTDMQGWPTGLPYSKVSLDAETTEALERTILATWLLMGQTLVRSERLVAQRPGAPSHRPCRPEPGPDGALHRSSACPHRARRSRRRREPREQS